MKLCLFVCFFNWSTPLHKRNTVIQIANKILYLLLLGMLQPNRQEKMEVKTCFYPVPSISRS